MAVSKIWSDSPGVDKTNLSPDKTFSALDYLGAVEAALSDSLPPVATLTNWAYLTVQFCRPAWLQLAISGPEVGLGVEQNLPSQMLSYQSGPYSYRGTVSYSSEKLEVTLYLDATDDCAVALSNLSDLTLPLANYGQLRLGWQKTYSRPVEATEWQQSLALGLKRLESFFSRLGLQNEIAALHQAQTVYNTLLSQAAHDLRGPFGSLLIASDLLLDKGLDLPATELRRLLQRLKRNVLALNGMVEHYFNIPQLTASLLNHSPNLQSLEVAPRLQTLAEMVAPQLERKEQTLKLDFDRNLNPEVWADSHYFDQILLNLLYNAQKHTPAGTRIMIEAELKPPYLQISVADNGPGLTPAVLPELEALFNENPNFQSEKSSLGLGLKLVKELIQRQHGLAGFSTGTGGTTFWVKLLLNP